MPQITIQNSEKKIMIENTQFFPMLHQVITYKFNLMNIYELLHYITKSKSKSSGPDNIPYLFIHNLLQNVKTFLCYLLADPK